MSTQFQPADARRLTLSQRRRDATGDFFDTSRAKTGQATIGTLSRRTTRIMDIYIKSLGVDLMDDVPIFRNRSGKPYSKDKLASDFRTIRACLGEDENRKLMDMRRSGPVEAVADAVEPASLSAKMGNSIADSKRLQKTYTPAEAATVRLADEARMRGRRRLRENET